MTKQPHLNGAYYGPSIPPPPTTTYHSPGRGGSCCCNPFSCCCSCIFNCLCSCILQIICTILVILALFTLLFWFIFRPNMLKFYTTNATLTQFNFNTNNNTLYYNLALNVTIRNPNKRIGIYYDAFELRGLYEGKRFGSTNVQPFYQGHKNSTFLENVVLKGQSVLVLGDDGISEYNKDKDEEKYDVDLKIYLRLRFKVGLIKSSKFKPRINCGLKVPLTSGNRTSSSYDLKFESTKCGLDWNL
ncbi:hypothetical protein LIER_03451 [Lithospermum erythrorhizon]|uniref:Late embryogenesis abundant protein LEA-2 subgroup domain-containing protein n=1 Tax=Lithospermum erythrorhizon TaxID=34254 RepID=A0AAV3NUH8_LITER